MRAPIRFWLGARVRVPTAALAVVTAFAAGAWVATWAFAFWLKFAS